MCIMKKENRKKKNKRKEKGEKRKKRNMSNGLCIFISSSSRFSSSRCGTYFNFYYIKIIKGFIVQVLSAWNCKSVIYVFCD